MVSVPLLGRRRGLFARPVHPAVPTQFLLRRDRTLRFRRGGSVYATDGRVGILRQIVVDEAEGAIVALVVQPSESRRAVILPAELVAMTAKGGVFLRENRDQFIARIAESTTYEKRHFTAANLRAVVTNGGRTGHADPRRGIIRAGRDFAETLVVVRSPRPGHRPPSAYEAPR